MVAALALLVVLDRLYVADTARSRPRCGTSSLRFYGVAAAIFMYDLGAHVGEVRRGFGRGRTAGSAPCVAAWESVGRVAGREGGVGGATR